MCFFDVNSFIGMNLVDARTKAEEYGFTIRVMKEGGEFGTSDLKVNRLNVESKDNPIISIIGVG